MNRLDRRGCSVSGAEPAALDAFERALAAYQGWHSGAEAPLALALEQAPGFVMAHVLQAYLLACSRDPRRLAMARPTLARAAALPANPRERLHIAAIAALLDDDDFDQARATLGELLRREPRDALALQVAHSLDYLAGDVECMNERVAAVLPAWSTELPGYHAILAMHAFGLEENGRHEEAEASARAALALDPLDARAHHAMAHVFEMTDRPEAGERWLADHAEGWANDTVVTTHCWWHRGLFQLALGRPDRALDIYHHHVRGDGDSQAVADLIDASALLWRIGLAGADTSGRWLDLADAWAPHIDDCFCSFNDLHAMLALVGARDWQRADKFVGALRAAHARPTRHGTTTRLLGLAACRALVAFGRGDDLRAITLLASLPAQAHRIGGSHAQRDVLHLTMERAIERLRTTKGWGSEGQVMPAEPVAGLIAGG